jgi:hypothetical protein
VNQQFIIVSRITWFPEGWIDGYHIGSMHDMMPLISLRLGLDRVDGAMAQIFNSSVDPLVAR